MTALGQKRKSAEATEMSVPGGRAEAIGEITDINTKAAAMADGPEF